jgi:hypothetical protein
LAVKELGDSGNRIELEWLIGVKLDFHVTAFLVGSHA